MDINTSLNILVHTVVQGGPVGPQEKEPLALLVLNHTDPVGWYAVVQQKLLGPAGPKMAARGHFGCPKITFDLISIHFTSIRKFNFLLFFLQNGRCQPF